MSKDSPLQVLPLERLSPPVFYTEAFQVPGPLPATEQSCELAHLSSSTSPGEDIIIPILQRYTLKLRETLYLARALSHEALGLKFQPSKELSSHCHTGHVNIKSGKEIKNNQTENQNKQRKSAFGV